MYNGDINDINTFALVPDFVLCEFKGVDQTARSESLEHNSYTCYNMYKVSILADSMLLMS